MVCGGRVSTAITAVAHEGLRVEVAGQPATLAIVDQHGNVIEAGPHVAAAAWNASIESYRNFLKGQGYLRVHERPERSE